MGKQSTTPSSYCASAPLRIALILLLALGSLRTVAQTTTSATTVPLLLPSAIVFDAAGNLYIAETANHAIRKVDTARNITIIAGDATQGFSGDNGPATAAQLDSPQGLALDTHQNLYIADTHNQRIRKLSLTTGLITTIAGTGTAGFAGDNAPALSARLNLPTALALDANRNLYLADTENHRIRRIDAVTGQITTIAGNGTQGFSGDNGPATAASIDSPTGLAVDAAGDVFLADTHNQRIRRIDATTGVITTIAGDGTPAFAGDNAAATSAHLALPHGLTIDSTGNLFLADTQNHRIRRIDATTGVITTIAGDGTQAFAGDHGPAIAASLDSPRAVIANPVAPITLADTGNQRIRQLDSRDSSGDAGIHTIAGPGALLSDTLSLAAPSNLPYGTGQITASLVSSTEATGPITFLDLSSGISTTLGTATLDTNTATFSTSSLSAGVHSITATYSGDATHSSAQSAALLLSITPQPLTATPTPATLLYGQPIPPLTGTLTGVLPQDAGSLLTSFTTPAAIFSPPATYPITAILSGPPAGNYVLTTTPASLTITQAPALVALTSSTDAGTGTGAGQRLTITTHVASSTSGVPTGTVTLLDGATTLADVTVSATGDVTYTTASFTSGYHSLTATYSGDGNFTPASSSLAILYVGTSP
ncbi:MAG: Ig-like domain repeat protein, partial [Edaphobacter sp.]